MLSLLPSAAAPVVDGATTPFSVHFAIDGLADPGVMPRVLELFAKRGLVPRSWHSTASGIALRIDVQVTGLERVAADHIARCMRQIHGVEAVLTVETRQAA